MSSAAILTEQQRQQILADWVPMPRYQLRCWVIKRLIRRLHPADFIEIGAASGQLAEWMSHQGMTGTATEISVEAIRMMRARLQGNDRVTIHAGDAGELPRPADLLVSMEVLEHIRDDRAALAQWFELVRPGGHMILSVPAHPGMFSAEDEMVGHYRRYAKPELIDKLCQAGFETPQVLAYGFPLGLLLKQLRTVASRRRLRTDGRSRRQRTEASGVERKRYTRFRWLLNEACLLPFNLLQMPFLHRDWSDGYIAVARRSAPQ